MATIRIHFPGNETPSLLNLNGSVITLGRLPHNTIQIIDRTISALHAEFIREGDHYRLHDRGSANGTFVNGDAVADYHLKDACRISFGTFECEFSPALALAGPDDSNETLPSRGEVNEVRHDNVKLRNQVELLREEVEALSKIHPPEAGGAHEVVPKEEFIRIVAQREKISESLLQFENEIKTLKSGLAILQRDRANLQRALDDAKAELLKNRVIVRKVEESEPESSELAVSAGSIVPEVKTPALTPSETALQAPQMPEAPSTPLAPPSYKTLPKPFIPPGMQPAKPPVPAAPAPAVTQPQTFAPAATVKVQPGTGSGIRPFAKGNPPAPQLKPGLAANAPMAPGAPAPLKPIAKPAPRSSVAAGPKGTQKLT